MGLEARLLEAEEEAHRLREENESLAKAHAELGAALERAEEDRDWADRRAALQQQRLGEAQEVIKETLRQVAELRALQSSRTSAGAARRSSINL